MILAFHVRRSAEMMENIRALPGSFSLAFVVHKDDFAHLSTYVRSFFEDKFAGSGLHFDFVSSGDVSVTELLARGTYTRVFVTNQIWEELNEEIRGSEIVHRPKLQVTQQSVKSAWSAIGVI